MAQGIVERAYQHENYTGVASYYTEGGSRGRPPGRLSKLGHDLSWRLLRGSPGGPEEAASVLILSRCEGLLIEIKEQVDAQP